MNLWRAAFPHYTLSFFFSLPGRYKHPVEIPSTHCTTHVIGVRCSVAQTGRFWNYSRNSISLTLCVRHRDKLVALLFACVARDARRSTGTPRPSQRPSRDRDPRGPANSGRRTVHHTSSLLFSDDFCSTFHSTWYRRIYPSIRNGQHIVACITSASPFG